MIQYFKHVAIGLLRAFFMLAYFLITLPIRITLMPLDLLAMFGGYMPFYKGDWDFGLVMFGLDSYLAKRFL